MIAIHFVGFDISPVTVRSDVPDGLPTVRELLRRAERELHAAGVDETGLNAEYLLARALDVGRGALRAQSHRTVGQNVVERFLTDVRRRCTREPLQYILGDVEFMGIRLAVTPGVLIPRPETETLAQEAIRFLEGRDRPRVLDVGTGSGNVAIAVALLAPHARVTAIDVSPEALTVARRNVESACPGAVAVELADVFSPGLDRRRFDLIVSNPPYVSSDEYLLLEPEIRDHEPRQATSDGGDGYRFLRRLGSLAASTLSPGGALMAEIGFGQSEEAAAILRRAGALSVALVDDLQGIPRVAVAAWSREA